MIVVERLFGGLELIFRVLAVPLKTLRLSWNHLAQPHFWQGTHRPISSKHYHYPIDTRFGWLRGIPNPWILNHDTPKQMRQPLPLHCLQMYVCIYIYKIYNDIYIIHISCMYLPSKIMVLKMFTTPKYKVWDPKRSTGAGKCPLWCCFFHITFKYLEMN